MNYIPCFVLIRLLFPLSLAACVVLRQNFISFIYLLLFLYSPWIHIPSSKSMAGATGRYLQVVIACSVLTNLAQITFQIVVLSLKSYSDITENCDFLEKLLRHIGFVSLKNVYWRDGFQAMSPDPLILFVSIIVYVLSNHLVLERRVSWPNMGYMLPEYKYVNASKRRFFFYLRWGKYVVLLSFCIAALIQPSVVGGVYFLVFIGGVTWWSLYRKMEKPFGIILHCISVVIALHIVAWFSMQLQWIQEYTRTCDVCRYLGLKPLVKVNCTNPYSMNLVDEETATFISPIFLFWLYIMVVLYGRLLKRLKLIQGHRIGKVVQPAYYHRESFVVTRPQSVHEESFPNEEGSGIPESEHKWSYMAKFGDFLYGGLQLLCRNLFILTTITMIAWSITYHSWLTFVLLLWASIIWLIPNQRQAMLRSSPFLVFYAICLLIIQYIYSLDLTNYERPNDFRGINLNQMGLSESSGHPSGPLAVKCLYTLVFWLTLRQLMEEKAAKRISAKMQAGKFPSKAKHPLERQPSKTYTVMTEVGNFMKNLLTKFCTWLVAIFLFLIGISGDRVTIFRIIYTAFFLVFVFAFQVSYTFWRKMLYGFWLTVIVYSMSILVLIYTYQFDNFDSYWENLGISATLQLDIGLEKYKTGELFIRLLIPTTTLIIAVLQMHYFHKDFLENSDIKRRISRLKSVQPSNELNPDTGYTNDDLKEEGEKERVIPTSQDASGSRTEVGETGKSPFQHINEFIEYVWLFMELHITKITLLCVFMLCIFDVCALHFIIVLLVVIAIPFGAHIHLFIANVCSVYSGALLLARMIYQIKYINHSIFVVNCTNLIEFDFPLRHYDRHISVNNMEWGGLLKADASQPFFSLIKGYIGVIFIVTFMAAVNIRQEYKRCLLPQPSKKQEVMFPNITRAEADDNITNCIKYLLNYVFYKFGVEICLMGLMAVIGIRMDFYAVLYCFWLCSLFALKRQTLMKVWTCFQIFIMVLILMQFALLVGLPPGLCIEYPWYSSITMRYTQEWMMLPDPLYPPSTYKVMFDFVLLILVNRQHVVFRIENAEGPDYPGGSNMDISDKIDDPDYINTVPDHVSQFRSWLDLMKRGILSSVMWVTLAIVFLAGANRVNIFSIGYLIGSFTFLWQGEDFYLRPLKVILTWWNTLIGYNVVVIAIKVLLQIVGCIFMESASDNACWAVQVLGIACIKKFGKDFHSSGVIESQECVISREGAGMAWDGVCFGFLIMICRLFKSHYFIHLVNETKAMTILASRGAELIQALHKKQIEVQQEGEYKILDKIKIKMEKIKAAQMKVQGHGFKEPAHHYAATRSGDYYMFEEYDDDLLEVDKFEEEPVEEAELMVQRSRRMTLSQLLTSALKTDIGTATDLARSKSSYDPLLLGQRRSSFFSAQSQISGLTGRRDSTTSRSDMAVGSPESASRRIPRVDEVDEEEPTKESSDSLPRDDSSDVLRSSASTWKTYLMFAWAFIESAMVSLTDCFNDHSKDYRYIIMALAVEKKLLKRNRDFGRGYRTGSGKIWQPTYGLTSSHDHTHTLEEMEKIYGLKDSEQHSIVRLVIATWFAVISNSEFMCYFTVFLHQIKSASIFSLPLPLMVFLWGTFSVPRPTKNFWVTIIAYTEVMVIVKCMFQFELIPWNQQLVPGKDPFFPPRILGIEQKPYYAAYDLVLLLVVFFHRFMLKSLGLWKSSYAEVKEELNEGEDFYYQTKDDDESKSTIMHSTHEVTGNNSMGNVPSLILVKREEEEPCENFPHILLMTTARYFDAVRTFFEDLLSNTRRVTVDIYAYMFLCDFFNFMVLLFGFASFGSAQSEGGVASYLQENKVPTPFLVMLILQFGLIVIDRGLYLRKNILGKIIFQFFLVFGVHIWMFFVLPAVTERPFHDSLPPQMWYMMKCFYLLFSAYQIRCGYPTRILGNFVCKRYNIINMILFKGFMTAPFLFELRALMDWIWTDTSMTLWDWLKMEDIFNGIYELKCTRRLENEYPQERGTRKYPLTKYLMGGGLLIGIIGFIWFPLVLFALGNTVGLTNIPNDITLSLRIGPYPPIYKMSVQNASIFQFNEKEWNYMLNYYKRNRKAQVFLSNYGHKDVAVAWFDRNSSSVWDITPPDQKRMIEMVDSDNPVEVKLTWTVLRYSNNPMYPEEISGSVTITLEPIVEGRRNPHRNELVKMLAGNGTAKPIFIQEIFPKFIAVTNHGRTSPVTHLMSGSSTSEQSLRSLHLNLFHDSYGNLKSTQEWWEVTEDINDDNYRSYLKNIPKANGDYIVLYTFSDKAFPEQFTFFFFGGAQGIIGLYLSIVALVAKILRSLIFGCTSTIMFVELPCVDRVLQLCLDIYLVRESKEYALEEDLYAKLIFLYRSPETLIKWTRFRDDETEDQPESYARPMLES